MKLSREEISDLLLQAELGLRDVHYDKRIHLCRMALAAIDMAEALKFYADRDNWDDDQFNPTIWNDGAIDLGRVATKALVKWDEV